MEVHSRRVNAIPTSPHKPNIFNGDHVRLFDVARDRIGVQNNAFRKACRHFNTEREPNHLGSKLLS